MEHALPAMEMNFAHPCNPGTGRTSSGRSDAFSGRIGVLHCLSMGGSRDPLREGNLPPMFCNNGRVYATGREKRKLLFVQWRLARDTESVEAGYPVSQESPF